MKVLIIEDEKPAARKLERMLNKKDIFPLCTLHTVKDAINWFRNNQQPDLIFLDIQLSDGISFEIFEQVNITSTIIFTTAFDEYALKAFKLNSIDYLLKPIIEEELDNALSKFNNFSNKASEVLNLKALENLLINNTVNNYKDRFVVKIGAKIKSIPVDTIECFFSDNKATYLFTHNKYSYLIDYSVEQIEELLNPKKYYRVSRKFIVNIDYIEEIYAYSNSRLKIKLNNFNEHEIIVSRERVKDFKNWL